MLKLSLSDIRISRTVPVVAGVLNLEEGVGLNVIMQNGVAAVQAGVGSANTEVFGGFAISERTFPALFPQLQTTKVALLTGTTYGITLTRAPVGSFRVFYTATNVALTLGSSTPSAGEYYLTGTTLSVNSADLAKNVTVQYQYTPTIQDLLALGGDNTPTTLSSMVATAGETGVIEAGTVATSVFDAAVDWTVWTPTIGLKVKAGGVVTIASGTGATITGGRVVRAPTAEEPFLVINFSLV